MAGKRYDSVQGYRFLLFLAVFLFHCGIGLFSIGWGGVQAFLVLSSFFLTTKLCKTDEINFRSELVHRVKRLYPPYLLLLLGCILLNVVAYQRIPWEVPVYLLSAQNFYWTFFGWSPLLAFGHTWYLTLDLYLFILWVLVIKFTSRNRLLFVSYAGIILSVLYRVICCIAFDNNFIAYTIPFGQMDSYCIGSVLAINMMQSRTARKYAFIDTLVGLAGIIACIVYVSTTNSLDWVQSYKFFSRAGNYTGDPIAVNIYLFVGVLSAGLFRLCLRVKPTSILSNRWMVKMGVWSYALYLFHFPFVEICMKVVKSPWLIAVITLPLTIFAAFIWHKYMEQKVVKLIGK